MKPIKMKLPKRIWHIIGISFIVLVLSATFITQSIAEKSPLMIVIWLFMLTFVFSSAFRLYQYNKLEKVRNDNNKMDFVDFYDSLTTFRLVSLLLTPFPIIKKSENPTENKLRRIIIVTVIISYGSFALTMLLLPDK
jgi:hypothetical protein